MDGVAARGLVSGRGPLRRSGRDVVGTCSDGAKPNFTYNLYARDQLFTGLRMKRNVYS